MAARLGFNEDAVYKILGYKPHRGQRLVHRSRARHKVVTAGRRYGKSQIGGHRLTPEALVTYTMKDALKDKGHRREFWIVGPEYTDSEKEFRVLWNDLTRLEVPMDHPGSYNNPQSGEMMISCWNGAFIVHAKSAKYPSTLVGEGLSGVILAEAAKLKPSVWHKYIRPTLADFRGWSLFSTTPEGKNWLYELWQRGQDPNDRHWESWRMPAWVNHYVYPLGATQDGIDMIRTALKDHKLTPAIIERSGVDEEIVDMMMDMTEERFAQEIEAKFTDFVGRVFKDFDEEIHVKSLKYNPDLPLYLATDSGWTNPFVALAIQIDVWDNVFVLGEYRTNHTDITDIAKDLQTWRGGLAKRATHLYPDPSAPDDTSVLTRELKLQDVGGTGGEIKWRLELIRQWLKLGPAHAPFKDQKPRIYIDRSCNGMPLGDGGLIREMQDYRYPDTVSEARPQPPENPMKKDDHGPEALGRFFGGHFGGPDDQGSGGAVVSTARM